MGQMKRVLAYSEDIKELKEILDRIWKRRNQRQELPHIPSPPAGAKVVVPDLSVYTYELNFIVGFLDVYCVPEIEETLTKIFKRNQTNGCIT